MAFDKKIAVELLGLFDNFPFESFLRSTEIHHVQWQKLIPVSVEEYPADTILWHLYILSHSNLIFPQLEIEEIHRFLENEPKQDSKKGEFVFEILQSILPKHTLTVQGYEYIHE